MLLLILILFDLAFTAAAAATVGSVAADGPPTPCPTPHLCIVRWYFRLPWRLGLCAVRCALRAASPGKDALTKHFLRRYLRLKFTALRPQRSGVPTRGHASG
jgi:hypothetical protein